MYYFSADVMLILHSHWLELSKNNNTNHGELSHTALQRTRTRSKANSGCSVELTQYAELNGVADILSLAVGHSTHVVT